LCCLDSVPAATLSSIGTTSTARDPCAQLLEAACSGDEEAFRRLVEPYRSPLEGHCYRMLGSLHDAEDAVQEALLRAWRGLCGFDGRSALRTWLFQITTNTCLDTIARRPKSGARPSETIRLEPYQDELLGFEDRFAAPEARYEQREAAELAFAAALQHLTPRQRAVLILRDALSLSAKEVSESLGTTVTSVNSALQRARKAVDDRLPPENKQSRMRSPDDERAAFRRCPRARGPPRDHRIARRGRDVCDVSPWPSRASGSGVSAPVSVAAPSAIGERQSGAKGGKGACKDATHPGHYPRT
jgi:RNA polymerase sigma factor (sigma-70 family)